MHKVQSVLFKRNSQGEFPPSETVNYYLRKLGVRNIKPGHKTDNYY